MTYDELKLTCSKDPFLLDALENSLRALTDATVAEHRHHNAKAYARAYTDAQTHIAEWVTSALQNEGTIWFTDAQVRFILRHAPSFVRVRAVASLLREGT